MNNTELHKRLIKAIEVNNYSYIEILLNKYQNNIKLNHQLKKSIKKKINLYCEYKYIINKKQHDIGISSKMMYINNTGRSLIVLLSSTCINYLYRHIILILSIKSKFINDCFISYIPNDIMYIIATNLFDFSIKM